MSEYPWFGIDFSSPDFKPFEKLPFEVSVPGNYPDGHKPHLTRRWFQYRNQATWSTFLLPKYGGGQPVSMIQIGVFEGGDLSWSASHFLTHPQSYCLAVDPWLPTTKLDEAHMEGVMERAMGNLAPWILEGKLQAVRGLSQDVLPTVIGDYDLVIIDGDHRASAVRQDAENALRLLKPGGWMVFDDVRQKRFKKDEVPAGLEQFLEKHGDKVKLVWKHRFCDCFEKVA